VIALVTGASGFVGRHLVSTLIADGVEVHAAVRSSSTRPPPSVPGVRVHRLNDPSSQIPEVVHTVQPAVVFHLATHFAARHQPSEIIAMLESNVVFGTTLTQACAETGARFVHATSAWQHFEGASYEPVSLYAATKQALVDIIEYFRVAEGLDAREVCLFDTYGPDDDRGKLISLLITTARSGAELAMSSGNQLIDLVHIDDVVSALLVAARAGRVEDRLVARTGAPLRVRELAEIIAEVSGQELKLRWGARPDRGREMVNDWAVSGNNLGWRPKVALRDGIAELWREL